MLVVYHPRYMDHDPGRSHPERRERIKKAVELLSSLGVKTIEPDQATEEDILRVHTREYVDWMKSLSRSGGAIDGDTPVPKGTYEIALLSAGGAIEAGKCILDGGFSFALIRPPGHHATREIGGGFCYFNNVAVMIEWMRGKGLRKFAVVDWDVHHGNGTQDIYYEDPSVLYLSAHQSPLYPGTGSMEEIGVGDGEGYTVNFPMPPESTGADFLLVLREVFIPLIRQFSPDIIAISCGFDAHFLDPLANLRYTIGTYFNATKELRRVAEEGCRRIAVLLEGGYNPDVVAYGTMAVISALSDGRGVPEVGNPPPQEVKSGERVERLKKILRNYWEI